MRRRAQIGRPDRRRNRYPLASAEGVLQHNSQIAAIYRQCGELTKIDFKPTTRKVQK
jgi:hypothetical protein